MPHTWNPLNDQDAALLRRCRNGCTIRAGAAGLDILIMLARGYISSSVDLPRGAYVYTLTESGRAALDAFEGERET